MVRLGKDLQVSQTVFFPIPQMRQYHNLKRLAWITIPCTKSSPSSAAIVSYSVSKIFVATKCSHPSNTLAVTTVVDPGGFQVSTEIPFWNWFESLWSIIEQSDQDSNRAVGSRYFNYSSYIRNDAVIMHYTLLRERSMKVDDLFFWSSHFPQSWNPLSKILDPPLDYGKYKYICVSCM